MSLRSRIDRLHRNIAEGNQEHCKTCQYPTDAKSVAVVTNEDVLGECSECGRTLDLKGRPLPHHAKIVVLHGGDVPDHFL